MGLSVFSKRILVFYALNNYLTAYRSQKNNFFLTNDHQFEGCHKPCHEGNSFWTTCSPQKEEERISLAVRITQVLRYFPNAMLYLGVWEGGQRRALSDWPVQSGISLVNLLEARENECRFVIHRFKVDRLQIIVVAKNITVSQLFISRMLKMCAIPQLVSAEIIM